MRKTQTESLSKAGASTLGIETGAPAGAAETVKSQTPLSNGTTAHWKSSYNGAIEAQAGNPILKSQRPEWSLPRQAYQSKRSFFYTESMRAFGTYGDNPIKVAGSEDAGKTNLHELK